MLGAKSWYVIFVLCEHRRYSHVQDMDLYNESRTLVYSGTLARRMRSDVGHAWVDLHVALLDNYRQFNPSDSPERPLKIPQSCYRGKNNATAW